VKHDPCYDSQDLLCWCISYVACARVSIYNHTFIFSQAVKAGGPNEETNKLLGDIIKESRMYNVPKDNIQVAHEACC
jgi:hypothetical protein